MSVVTDFAQELLSREDFAAQLLEIMPRVQERAEEVLANVKRKGAAQGDVMDAATERFLRPQVGTTRTKRDPALIRGRRS